MTLIPCGRCLTAADPAGTEIKIDVDPTLPRGTILLVNASSAKLYEPDQLTDSAELANALIGVKSSKMHQSSLDGLLLLTLFAVALPWPAGAETRIALVVGNSAYPSGPLGSPKDDAKAIEAKLKVLGFQVIRKTDLGREGFFNAIREFGDRLQQPGTVGLFYYSGHGMQVNNRNYMIPTDVDIRSNLDVGRFAVPVEDVLVRMEVGKSNPNFVILDACRNNPFEKRFKSSQDGLAQMDAPPSTVIAFAAAPGKVAKAGWGGKLSLYTAALAEHIDQPYPTFVSMFQSVQNAVYEDTYTQSPRLELSPGLPDFSFLKGKKKKRP